MSGSDAGSQDPSGWDLDTRRHQTSLNDDSLGSAERRIQYVPNVRDPCPVILIACDHSIGSMSIDRRSWNTARRAAWFLPWMTKTLRGSGTVDPLPRAAMEQSCLASGKNQNGMLGLFGRRLWPLRPRAISIPSERWCHPASRGSRRTLTWIAAHPDVDHWPIVTSRTRRFAAFKLSTYSAS
jgi:hypothetical protein